MLLKKKRKNKNTSKPSRKDLITAFSGVQILHFITGNLFPMAIKTKGRQKSKLKN